MKSHPSPFRRRGSILLGIGLVLFASCGSDDDPAASIPTSAITVDSTLDTAADPPSTVGGTPDATVAVTPSSDHAHQPPTVTIGLRDYAFEDVPASVELGTTLSISNTSTTEVHELVVVQLPPEETRTAAELVALAPAELGALIGTSPAHVLIAPPGESGVAVVGDGVLDEPGRFLLLCSIPIGADPEEYLAAAQSSDGPPQVAGGPPHFTAGMFGELIVEPSA